MDVENNLQEHRGDISLVQKIKVNCPVCHRDVELIIPEQNTDYKSAFKMLMDVQKNTHSKIDEILKEDAQDRDNQLLDSLSNQLTFARDGMIAFTREHAQVLDKIKDIEKGLKAQRDARVKRVEDSKTTWQGYVRLLEDEVRRRDAGEDAEIMRMAKDKAKDRLSQWHQFEDGIIDQPLLTPQSVKDETEAKIETHREIS